MILSFKIENFRSIKESLNIDMTTEKRLKEPGLEDNSFMQNNNELLKSMLLYGRNASGKSNVLIALNALLYLIDNSDTFKHGELLKPYEPFIFDKKFINKPVKFEINFITVNEKNKFKYVLEFNANEIVFEALYTYPSGTKAKLYERIKNKVTYGEYYKGVKKKIENDLLPNQLFLSKSASSKIPFLNDCHLYFSQHVYVSTIHDTEYDKSIIRSFSELLKNDDKLKHNLLEL
ncbi:MAG: AAA family ATPase, partial [Bacteroidota bacterium]|nr:AAA family ATPase [Bacteroidota bacterium]